ncbi:MAG TPA: TetR/AcrR family transcriptional regulator [Spirochaetia bacterium]|nr:TetR/AcrR family transcriptional regulator [Spirochaetia bacterium]
MSATLDLIVEDGIQAVSFSKIFSRAGVGSGTVYNYFTNKEELVNAVYLATSEMLDQAVLLGYDPAAEIKARFATLFHNMAGFVLSNRKELALLNACDRSPYVSEELRLRTTPAMEAALSLLSDGQKSGVFNAMNPMMTLKLLTGAIIAVAQGQLDGKYRLDDEEINDAVEACWRAVARVPERRVEHSVW